MWFFPSALAAPPITTAFSASQEHSCSQSWETNTYQGVLNYSEGKMSVQGTWREVSGSQNGDQPYGNGGQPPFIRTEALACSWEEKQGVYTSMQSSNWVCKGSFVAICQSKDAKIQCTLSGSIPPLLALLSGPDGLVMANGWEINVSDYGWGSLSYHFSEKGKE